MKNKIKIIIVLFLLIVVSLIIVIKNKKNRIVLKTNLFHTFTEKNFLKDINQNKKQIVEEQSDEQESEEVDEKKEKDIDKKEEKTDVKETKKDEKHNISQTKEEPNDKTKITENQTNKTENNVSKDNTTIETETKEESTKGKYNITIITTTTYTYEVDKNENKKLVKQEVTNTKYDNSTFDASTGELKPEAQGLVSSNISQYNEMLGYVNNLRNENGKEPLTLDNNLNLAATIRALEMAWSSKFSHTRPDGRSCFTIFDDLGISYSAVGENIAGGTSTPNATFNMWNNSQGHHDNMISSNFKKIGVGKATVNGVTFWVQLFSN